MTIALKVIGITVDTVPAIYERREAQSFQQKTSTTAHVIPLFIPCHVVIIIDHAMSTIVASSADVDTRRVDQWSFRGEGGHEEKNQDKWLFSVYS